MHNGGMRIAILLFAAALAAPSFAEQSATTIKLVIHGGAGAYANDQCGVSATGHGEFFIHHAVAFDICARLRHNGSSVGEAARQVIHEVLGPIGSAGGVIVLDRQGHHATEFNTLGMFRGWIDDVSGKAQVEIYE